MAVATREAFWIEPGRCQNMMGIHRECLRVLPNVFDWRYLRLLLARGTRLIVLAGPREFPSAAARSGLKLSLFTHETFTLTKFQFLGNFNFERDAIPGSGEWR